MARRSDHSRPELTAMMLAAARAIIAEQGLQGLTARKLGAAVGYSPGSIYNVFGNLDGLIIQVNAETLDRLIAELSQISMTGEPKRDLAAVVEHYLVFEAANPKLWSALFDHDLKPGTTWPDWYLAKIDAVFTLAEAALVPLFGTAATPASRRAIQALWAGLHGITSLARSGSLGTVADETARSLARHLSATYLAGLMQGARRA